MDEELLARAFAEWERRARAVPDGFHTQAERTEADPEQLGRECARYLLALMEELA